MRADLQQYYGIDLDHARRGVHSPNHIAWLVIELPNDARCRVVENNDAAWTLDAVVLAGIFNRLNALIYGMSDKRSRGNPPPMLGPSWMTDSKNTKSLPARVMPASELLEILSMPRGVDDWQN